jgi:hypothetical protein
LIYRLVPHAPLISVFDFAIPWLHLWLGRFTGQARVQRLPLSRYKLSFHVGSGVIGCSRRSARRRDRVSRLLADAHRQRRGLYRASPLGDGFAWLGTPSALIMLSVAALVEVLAYTIPVIDNLLDVVSAPAAFIAGTILSAAVMTGMPPMVKWTAAVIAGGGVAGLMRGSIGVLRAHSTVLTGGLGELRHLHCGTWRRGAHILFGACRADRGDRAGRAVPVRDDAIAPPVASRRQTIERSDIGDSRRLPCFALARRLRFGRGPLPSPSSSTTWFAR